MTASPASSSSKATKNSKETKSSSRRRVQLLRDEPADVDSLGHDSIASAIRDLIAGDIPATGIRLLGLWGSGKSTIVRLLSNSGDSNTAVFVFDAWAHRDDYLRRAFLERLIDTFLDRGWLNPQNWNIEKEKLAARLTSETSTVIPQLTIPGIIYAIALLLAGVGFALVSLFDSQGGRPWDYPAWIVTGIVLIALPIVAVILLNQTWWYYARKDKKWKEKHRWGTSWGFLAGVFSESKETKTTAKIENPQPSTVEFEAVYQKILKEALAEETRRLVIVIDNLDRLDDEAAMETWAAMQLFHEATRGSTAEFCKRAWLLVPIDPSASSRLWRENADEEDVKQSSTASEDTRASDSLSNQMLRKSLPIVFRVPEPVLSKWRQFFELQLVVLFPGKKKPSHSLTLEEVRCLISVFEHYVVQKESITPRRIKSWLNEIATSYLQSEWDAPLVTHAVYASTQGGPAWDVSAHIVREHDIPITFQSMMGDGWKSELAAIHYGNTPNEAGAILIEPKLLKVFDGNQEDISKLAEIPGFWIVSSRLISEHRSEWTQHDTRKIVNVITALRGIDADSDPHGKHALDELAKAALEVSSWTKCDVNTGIMANWVAKRRPKDALTLIGSIWASLPSDEEAEDA